MRVVLVLALLVASGPRLPAGTLVPIRGDVDGSGAVDALDVFYLIHYLNSSGVPIDTCKADANSDLVVTNLDIQFLASHVFGSGPAPAPIAVYFRDADADGFGNASDSVQACTAPPGYVLVQGDCNDSNSSIYPGAFERCNSLDDDCDGQADEDFPTLGQACTVGIGECQRSGTIVCKGDGSGTQCSALPGLPSVEVCNGLDDNCDGGIDEGLSGCFLMTPGQAPWPSREDASHSPDLPSVDGYLLLDRSGSMSDEISTIKSNAAAAISAVRCPPSGTGTVGQCIEDLWFGAGTIGYTLGDPYRNHVDLQANPAFTGVPTNEPSGCCNEAFYAAIYSTVTGGGSPSMPACTLQSYAARTSCSTSPAGVSGLATVGYPCFRSAAGKYAFLFTDEAPSANAPCPSSNTAVTAAQSIGLRIVGLYGSGSSSTVINELNSLATQSGAVNPSDDNAPLVFDASGTAAATAFQAALQTIAGMLAVDISAELVDDPSDAVDTSVAFVDRVETLSLGTADCPSTYATFDRNGDGFHETYGGVTTSAPLCWRVVLKQNDSVTSGPAPQTFGATLRFLAEGTVVEERPLVFVVP